MPRNKIRRLYDSEAQGILDEELLNEVGYGLLARCESILAITRGHFSTPVCPGCLQAMEQQGEAVTCKTCSWSTTVAAFRDSYKKKRLHAGRMEPFIEAFVDDFRRARSPNEKMRLIDILIHRCHGEYEAVGGERPGATNLIGGRPREVAEFLDTLGGTPRRGLASTSEHKAWVERVRRERRAGWRGAS